MNEPNQSTPVPSDPASPSPFDAFRELASKLAQVPKAEVDEREAEYQREREGKPKPGPKPH